MDGSGIDFVEADFGQDGGAGPSGSDERRVTDWKRWQEAKVRYPVVPIVVAALLFFFVVFTLPGILINHLNETMDANAPSPPVESGHPQAGRVPTAREEAPASASSDGFDRRFGSPR